MLGDLQDLTQRSCEDVGFKSINSQQSRSGFRISSSLETILPNTLDLCVGLACFRSCPGMLSINYAEEMNQLDTAGGEPEASVAGLLPEQKG